jgi:hypothetical protein
MSKRTVSLALLVGCLVLPFSTHALQFYDAATLERLCRSSNGTFLTPTLDSPAYGCLGRSNAVICGGKGKYAKTCSAGHRKKRMIRQRNKGGD